MAKAEDQLARLDEIVRRSSVGPGFIERGHFFDAAATMWVAGELVHVEDLVLHDAHMDIRAPTHELTIGHAILRARRRIAGAEPDWAISEAGVAALTGGRSIDREETGVNNAQPEGEGESDELFSREFAEIDAILDRSQQLIDSLETREPAAALGRTLLVVGDLLIRDPEWDEGHRLQQWHLLIKRVSNLPPVLAAALLFDAWNSLEPVQRQHWLGSLLVSAYLRSTGKVTSHLPCFNVGLKAIPRERRRGRTSTIRLLAFLDAMSAAADSGMKEIARLSQAREQMERRLRGKRSSSNLPAAIDLILSRPIVSAGMLAKTAKVTPRGALNLIAELGAREMTGRGRYRAWGVL